jgi:hypothetical protein
VPAGASLAGELLPMFAVGPGGLSVRFRWVSDLRLRQKDGIIAAVKLTSILQYSPVDYRPVSIPAAKVRRPIVETALVRGDVVVRRNGGGSGPTTPHSARTMRSMAEDETFAAYRRMLVFLVGN